MKNYIKPPYLNGAIVFFFDDENEADFARAYEKAEAAIAVVAKSKYRPPFAVWRRFRGMPRDLCVVGE